MLKLGRKTDLLLNEFLPISSVGLAQSVGRRYILSKVRRFEPPRIPFGWRYFMHFLFSILFSFSFFSEFVCLFIFVAVVVLAFSVFSLFILKTRIRLFILSGLVVCLFKDFF